MNTKMKTFRRMLISLPIFAIVSILTMSCAMKKRLAPSSTPQSSSSTSISASSLFSWETMDKSRRRIEDVQQRLATRMEEFGVMGVSIGIKQRENAANPSSFLLNIGSMSNETKFPIDSKTVFRADRFGQPVMAYIVLRLAYENRFDIDTRIINLLPESFRRHPLLKELYNNPRLNKLTSRMILSHQSGWPLSSFAGGDHGRELVANPGKDFYYSEDAYGLLRLLLEYKLNLNLNEIAKQMVFDPFGMSHSRFVPQEDALIDPVIKAPAFYTNAGDFSDFIWIVLKSSYQDLGREYSRSYYLNPAVFIKTRSILENLPPEDESQLPQRLGWSLGWGMYYLRKNDLSPCLFIGGNEGNIEYYSTRLVSVSSLYENYTSIYLTVFVAGSNPHSFMPIVVEEILGKIDTPLAWLGFN